MFKSMPKEKKTEFWTPDPQTILKLYQDLENGPGWLELDWKCPDRRPPTPPGEKCEEKDKDKAKNLENAVKELAFDFDEFSNTEPLNTPQQRRIGAGGLKGSARKMTTSLDGVLSNMRRHKIIDDNMDTEYEETE